MHRFLIGDNTIRGAALDATLLIRQMRANHELGILETLILGHAYMGALLITSQLKGQDTISLSVDCQGPAKGFVVEANAFGEVRGYLRNPNIPVNSPIKSNDYSEFFGPGTLSVTRILEGGKQPFTSRINLEHGNIAQDLANYFTTSEQTPSGFHLSIRFDTEGKVIGAGGLMLQTMPGADPDTVRKAESQMMLLPSMGSEIAHGQNPMDYIGFWFQDFGISPLEPRSIDFHCRCSKERFVQQLRNLPKSDREDIRENGPFPLVLNCHFCNSSYQLSKTEVQGI
jgi:molecular chaperone Hsp33